MSKHLYTPARLWEPVTGPDSRLKDLRCRLCAHYCRIPDLEDGLCGVRRNWSGELFTRSASELAAANLDPVEKKPLYHFLPGSQTFSIGSFGCNFRCDFCQNSDISQYTPLWDNGGHAANPVWLVREAQRHGAASISYTYNEPTVFFELMQPTAALAHDEGLRNIMVSNAYMSPECFEQLDGLIDAANFDLKSFSGDFYQRYCGARLKPVLQTIERAVRSGWWVELTTLVISGLNDSTEELEALALHIRKNLGPDVPWHVSRFRPAYRMVEHPATGMESIARALEAGYKAGLNYVYAGNIPGHEAENTFCPSCRARIIARHGYRIGGDFSGICPECRVEVAGFWK